MPLSASLEMTPLCRMLDLTAPVVQAPVGSATTPELVAAVSNAGGLGMLALTWTPAGSVRESIRATRALTDRPFGVNLVLEWAQEERVQACAEESVAAVSTFWGDPRPYVDRIHAGDPHRVVTVILPEFIPARWWQHLLHNQSSLLLKGALLFRRGIIVTSVPYHLEK